MKVSLGALFSGRFVESQSVSHQQMMHPLCADWDMVCRWYEDGVTASLGWLGLSRKERHVGQSDVGLAIFVDRSGKSACKVSAFIGQVVEALVDVSC
jgi:hypothetical protein